jgi:hypothetical protein
MFLRNVGLSPKLYGVTKPAHLKIGIDRQINTNIIFLYIIHRALYISKHNFSETGFCLRLQAKTSVGPNR